MRGFLASTRVQGRVISALVVREAVARFGHQSLGFFWVMAEPLLFSGAVMILWAFSAHAHLEEIGVVLFVLTGYSSLMVWRHFMSRSVRLMRSQASLMFHAQVRPFDVIVAVAALDVVGNLAAFLVAYVPLATFELVPPPTDLALAAAGWVMIGWFCFACGLVVAGLSELWGPVDKFMNAFLYMTIPLTGAFTLVDWLPQKARDAMLYSPLVHAVEMFRAGLFPPDVRTYFDVEYLIWSCAIITAVGLQMMFIGYRKGDKS
jgi:capsular polysaccharide transport system permease protein